MSAVGISAAISLDKSALIEYSVPELLLGFTPARLSPSRQNKPAANDGFHNNIRTWRATKQLRRWWQQRCQSPALTQQPSVRFSPASCCWRIVVRGRLAVRQTGQVRAVLFAAVQLRCFQKLSRTLSGPWRPRPAVHLAGAEAPADWPTRTLRQAGVHLYSALAAQLPTSPWGPSLPRGPGASCVPAF